MRAAIRMQTYSVDEADFVFLLNDKQSMKQLDWEGNDEFSFNGEMYDVIEKKIERWKADHSFNCRQTGNSFVE